MDAPRLFWRQCLTLLQQLLAPHHPAGFGSATGRELSIMRLAGLRADKIKKFYF
jgi:hypothetical protein